MDFLKTCQSVRTDIFNWVDNNTINAPFDSVGNPIQKYIPPVFEAYCKILHPFVIDMDAPNIRYNETAEIKKYKEKAITNICERFNWAKAHLIVTNFDAFLEKSILILKEQHQITDKEFELPLSKITNDAFRNDVKLILSLSDIHPYRDFNKFLMDSGYETTLHQHPINDRSLEKVVNKNKLKWSVLATQSDLIFHSNINPMSFQKRFKIIGQPINLYFPSFGFDIENGQNLLSVLKQHTPTQKFYHRFHNFIKNREEQYLCPLKSMMNNNPNDSIIGGELIDESKTWMLYQDSHRDLQLAILGGTKQLIEALKKHPNLEVVECSPISRVDYNSDNLNVFEV